MRMRVSTGMTSARTPNAGRQPERSPRQRRVLLLALGALMAALLAFSTAIEYGTASDHHHAVLASDDIATGHNSVTTNGDGTAIGMRRY